MYETCINRSCSKAETLLRRTETFGLVCLIYAFLSSISKAKTAKRTLLQEDNFFQSSDKKVTCFTPVETRILIIFEKQRITLDIFVKFLKNKHFFTLWNNNNFFGPASARSYKIGVVGNNNWLVGNAFSQKRVRGFF